MTESGSEESREIRLNTNLDSFLEEREFSELVSGLNSSSFLSKIPDSSLEKNRQSSEKERIWQSTQKMILHNSAIGGFHLLCELARGELGRIFLGKHKDYSHNVAIRLIPITESSRPIAELAGQISFRVKHRSIVPVLKTGIAQNFFYQATGFVSGPNYKEVIREGRVFTHTCLDEFLEVCKGVEEAHRQGFYHLGIEPAGLHRDHKGRIHLSGWGLSPFFRKEAIGKSVSTKPDRRRYTAPELQLPEECNEVLCDVFSLGGVLYDLIAESQPFASSIGGRIPNTSFAWPIPLKKELPEQESLRLICQKCLCPDPADRYENVGMLCADLGNLISGKPISLRNRQTLLSKIGSWLNVKT